MRPRLNGSTLWAFCLTFAAGTLLLSPPAVADVFKWLGTNDSNWQTTANWDTSGVADFNGPPSGETWGHRLQVDQGALKSELVYDGSLGTTVYASPSGDPNKGRGLIIGNGATGAMRITGGTFSTWGSTSSDLVGNQSSGIGTLTIAGGNYISSSTGLYLGTGVGGTSTLTVSSGSALITTLRVDATTATVNLNGGTLQANVIDVQGGTNTFNFNGGTLVAGAASTTFMQGLDTANVRDGGAVINTNGYNITIAQALLHSSIGGDAGTDGGLTKTGTGTLTLSGTNTYTGVTTIAQGTLKLGNAAALGTAAGKTVIQSGATLDIAGFKAGLVAEGAIGNEPIEVSGSGVGGLGALINNGDWQTQAFSNIKLLGDTTFGGTGRWDLRSGTFAVGGHTITKVGTNAVSIVSATVTNPGDVNVNAGLFRIEGLTSYNATAPVTISVASGARLDYWGTTIAHNPNIVLNGGTVSVNSNSTPSFSGTITLNAGSNIIGVGNEYQGPTLTVTGQITGAGGFTLDGRNTSSSPGTGILILANATNDYSGTTTISTGTLRLGAAGAIPDGSGKGNVILNAGTVAAGTFDLNGLSETINGLEGSAGDVREQVVNSAVGTTSTLTVGNGNVTTVFAGLLRDNTGTGGTLALTKTGTGTLTLSGTNTYTGATNVTAGVLQISHASALGGTTAGTTVANGARIELAGGITVTGESLTISGYGGNNRGALQTQSGTNTWTGSVTLGANDTRIGAVGAGTSLTISGAIGDGGANHTLAIRNDGGTTILSGANTYGGNTDVVIGLLKLDGGDNRLPTGTVLRMGYTEGNDISTFDLSGWNQQVAGLLARATTTKTTVTNSSATPSILTVNNGIGYIYSGVLTGNLALTKAGPGQLTLSGANTYNGLTTVDAGMLLVTGSLANNGSSHVQVASAGTAFGSADPTIVRTVAAGSSFAGLGSQIIGGGTHATRADLLAGSNGGTSPLDVAMAWRTFDSADTAAFPALTDLVSDVVQLTGMGTGETDPFILQMSYSSSLVQPNHDGLFLAWLSPTDGWVNAVEGNFGTGGSAMAGATGSWDSVVNAGDLASYVGTWGIDSGSGTAWAVLNHNSQFAVLAVPEPSSLLLGCMGLVGLLLAVRRRR
ncbi:MAG: autotransporter-associated beta strand repeat-containing protein [Patescibacteria group bacterium]|nr:autotransporter-associated beta strand repeat-containing protein [Patescibacteria group bacterium]